MADQAHAVQIGSYGPPEVLEYRPVPLLPLRHGEVRIKTIAAAVNHTDLKIRAGLWPIRRPDPFPYVPGVEVVGEVSEVGAGVRELMLGDRVITMMHGMGGVLSDRPGGYATHITVAESAAARLPGNADPYAMAALGLAAVTAYEGLRRLGDLAGHRILVIAAR